MESRYNLPVLCEQENVCKREFDACGGKCLDPTLPTLSFNYRGLSPICTNLNWTECIPEGPIVDKAGYMCNGICIPVFVPCNNTCLDNILWRTNRREELFGPVKCQDFEEKARLREDNVLFLKSILDFQGFCLPGSVICNGTCLIDPRRPLVKAQRGRDDFECVEACHRIREWPCNGTCIEKDKPCGNSCRFDHFRCKGGKCIAKHNVCDSDNKNWNDCDDGEDEEDCPANCKPKSDYDFSDRILVDGNGTKSCKSDMPTQESCEGKILCDEDKVCIELHRINNGEIDCEDGSDENIIIRKIPIVEGVTYRSEYENQEEYIEYIESPIENRTRYYFDDYLSNFLWICNGQLLNISTPCHGECNSKKEWKLCAGENGSGFCAPKEENCPNTTDGILISSSSKDCRFGHR